MNLPTLSAADLERIGKAARLAKDRSLFVMLEPDESLALVALASESIFSSRQLKRTVPGSTVAMTVACEGKSLVTDSP